MSQGQRGSDRETCDELARELCTDEGLHTARLLQRVGLFDERDAGDRQSFSAEVQAFIAKVADTSPKSIGVWSPERDAAGDLVFVRPNPLEMNVMWAPVKTLTSKKQQGRIRICMVGESAAAGFLYAPHLTPSKTLAHYLNKLTGSDNHEVIDLAVAGQTPEPLVDLALAARQLNPDLLVVFAGNNWLLSWNQTLGGGEFGFLQGLAGAVRTAGIAGIMDACERRNRELARTLLRALAVTASGCEYGMIFVAPEANVTDFQYRQPVYWLPGGGSAAWYTAFERALDALERGAHQTALEAAEEMLRLDGGACATTHELLSLAWSGLGRTAEAEQAGRAAVTAGLWDGRYRRPSGSPAYLREELQLRCSELGVGYIDLAAVLSAYSGEALPGRRMFLDHCHLSAEGLKVAMAATAAEVVARIGKAPSPPADWRSLVSSGPDISPEADATANLQAALYNAHLIMPIRGETADVVDYWLDAALERCPDIAPTMMDYLEARLSPAPAYLTAAQERNLHSPFRLPMGAWIIAELGVSTIEPMCRALERAGHQVRPIIDRTLREHRGIPPQGLDLAAMYWRENDAGIQRYNRDLAFVHAIYRARLPTSTFYAVPTPGRDLEIALTARLPGYGGTREDAVEVSVNGRKIAVAPVGSRWTRTTIVAGAQDLREGLNRVSLRWPNLPPVGDEVLRSIVRQLELGTVPDVYPIFGEVAAMVVRER